MKNPPSVVASRFASRVRELRKERKLSQESFAAIVGIDRTYQSQIERGIANPSLEILCAIANHLDAELATLIGKDV